MSRNHPAHSSNTTEVQRLEMGDMSSMGDYQNEVQLEEEDKENSSEEEYIVLILGLNL